MVACREMKAPFAPADSRLKKPAVKHVAFHALGNAYSIGYVVCGIAAVVAALLATLFLGATAHESMALTYMCWSVSTRTSTPNSSMVIESGAGRGSE